MLLKRIRLQSLSPLPSFRVWFLVPQDAVDVQSLKLAISAQLPALKGMDIQAAQIVLEMDGFELLDECSIDLIREGDIIVVNAKAVPLDRMKSKANVEKATKALKRRKLSIRNKESLRRSSTSASDSSTSDSSTSDPSTSESSTPSSSSDLDSADSKPLPCPDVLSLPSNQNPQSKGVSPVVMSQATSHFRTSGMQQPTVPPGLGKASTHSRNRRRKLKRKYAGSDGVSLAMQSSDQPASVSIIPRSTTQPNNKTNGPMEGMEGTGPQKLDSNSSVPTISRCAMTFIPPSEREDLPKNIFVTSVEINWRTNQRRTARQDPDKAGQWVPPDHAPAIQLFDPGLHQYSDWAVIETAWEKYQTLDASMELLPDTVVGWKAFGLDPVTLTPQASMLHLGKVVSVDMEIIVVQPLTRPNLGHATFGRTSVGEDHEFVEQISHPLSEVWTNEWKLISHQ